MKMLVVGVADVGAVNEWAITALHLAVLYGRVGVVGVLLGADADGREWRRGAALCCP